MKFNPEHATSPALKWAIIGLLALIAILLVGGRWFYLDQEKKLRKDVKDNLNSITQLKANQIAAWRTDLLVDVSTLSEDVFFSQRVVKLLTSIDDEDNIVRVRTRLYTHLNKYKYRDIMIVDPTGAIRMNLTKEPGSGHFGLLDSLAESFREQKPIISDLYKSPSHSSPHLHIVAPIFTGEGDARMPMGAIIFIIDADTFLYPLITSWPIPSRTAESLLVRRDGDDVLFLNNLRNLDNAALNHRIPLSRTDVPAVMAVLGKRGITEGIDYRGVKVLSILQPIPNSPWLMITKVDEAEALATPKRESLFILTAIFGLVVIAGTIGVAAWQQKQKQFFRRLYREEVQHRIILNSIGDGVIVTDIRGRIKMLNPEAGKLTGYTLDEAKDRPLDQVFHILNENSRERVENPVTKVLQTGTVINLAQHSLLIAKDGTEIPIVDSGAPIKDEHGTIIGVVLIFRDHTGQRLAERLIETRLAIVDYSANHSLEELLTYCLDTISAIAGSPIAFFHFVESDQKTLSLQQWSTRTLKEFCQAEGRGMHYNIDQAGVWVDCIEKKEPVIHNDYNTLPHRKGLPPGHAPIIRELVVPVLRQGRVDAILGVGNKIINYTDRDAEIVSYLADVTWETIQQKRNQAESERLMTAIEQAGEIIYITDPKSNIQYVNPAFQKVTGYSRDEVLGKNPRILKSGQHDNLFYKQMFATISKGETWKGRMVNKRKDGALYTEDATISPVLDATGKILNYVAIKHDISENLKIEAQFMQAQKMESVGRLAGGVAHDYNNMLSVILGYSELALESSDLSDQLHEDLHEIHNAAMRSAKITRQLLAFARKQTIAPVALDLNEAVEGMLKMLRRLIGEDIDLAWLPETGLSPVEIDPSQLDQLLANLCVNARDAIAGVGKITIETGTATFDAAYCADHPGFIPGEYVLLAVSDDGCGMDHDTASKIFEPFFTTKEIGQGSGLGLAMVYGIVKQNNGFINVYSEPGKGSTFKIYLSRHTDPTLEAAPKIPESVPVGHGEIILIVEDEPSILKLASRILGELGYTVLTAESPQQAMALVHERPVEIELLITDVVMPTMNGRELSNKLHELCPKLKTLFMSGYTANVIAHRGVLDQGVNFIQKPFSVETMAIKVREALDI
jgi:two-component system, cell cycle sensor histidine kinase and response regulator CckA